MKLYKIGEFAHKFGISTDFLKYYDKEGLLKPVAKDTSKYRYYADYQAVHLAEYYRMSRAGLSLKEIKELVGCGSLLDYSNAYRKCKSNLERKINMHQDILDFLNQFLKAADSIQNNCSWYIVPMEETVFCHAQIGKTDGNDDGPWWKYKEHVPTIWQRVTLDPNNTSSIQSQNCERIFGELLSPEKATEIAAYYNLYKVPASRAFLYYHRKKTEYSENGQLADSVWNCSEPLELLKLHNLVPKGDIYQQRLCSAHENGESFMYMMTLRVFKVFEGLPF